MIISSLVDTNIWVIMAGRHPNFQWCFDGDESMPKHPNKQIVDAHGHHQIKTNHLLHDANKLGHQIELKTASAHPDSNKVQRLLFPEFLLRLELPTLLPNQFRQLLSVTYRSGDFNCGTPVIIHITEFETEHLDHLTETLLFVLRSTAFLKLIHDVILHTDIVGWS